MSEINLINSNITLDNEIKIAIVASRFNRFIVDRLYTGAIKGLTDHGITNEAITVVNVPGAFEIPVAVKNLLDKKKFDAIITLGAVIRGETPHFDYICSQCSHAVSMLAANSGVPIIFGVLTVDDTAQAMDRAGDEESNKGYEAASAALDMIAVIKKLKS